METYETNQQLGIERLEEENEFNYRIVAGNPLNGNHQFEIFANSLKINNHAMSAKSMQIGEYQQKITVELNNNMANIMVEHNKRNTIDRDN